MKKKKKKRFKRTVVLEMHGNTEGAVDTIEVLFLKENSFCVPIDQLERDIMVFILNKSPGCLIKSVLQRVKMEEEKLGYLLEIPVRDGSDVEFGCSPVSVVRPFHAHGRIIPLCPHNSGQ